MSEAKTDFWQVTFLAPHAKAAGMKGAKRVDDTYSQVTKDIYLPSARQIRKDLVRSGFIPMRIERKRLPLWKIELVDRQYKLRFMRSVLFHMESGASAADSLRTVISSEDNQSIRLRMEPTLEVIERGGMTSQAVAAMDLFDRITVAILESGERIGDIKSAMQSVVDHLESSAGTMKMFMAAFSWIAIDAFMAVSSVVGVQWKFIPMIVEQGVNSEDPAVIAKFENAIWWAQCINWALLAVAAVVTVVAVAGFSKRAVMVRRGGADPKWLEQVPMVNSVLVHSAIGETVGIVSKMLRGRVNLMAACDIARSATRHFSTKQYWAGVRKGMQAGMPPGEAMTRPPLTRGECVEVQASHDVDQLAGILSTISAYRADQAKSANSRLIKVAFYATLLYGAASVGAAMFALWTQNSSLQNLMGSLSG